jgi:hypothetical protein
MPRFHTLAVGGNAVVLDAEIGHLRGLRLSHGGHNLAPLHTAPWVTDDPIDRSAELPPTEQGLSGDFLCAPFCANDVEPGPLHGWTANGPWQVTGADATSLTATLPRPVMGATVSKTLQFRPGEPFLYQSHTFTGGTGEIPIGHHAMIHASRPAALSFSPKALWFTANSVPEPDPARGRSLLRYPGTGADLGAVPLADGGAVDIRTYPFAQRHEDIVSLEEQPGHALGWTAALRPAEGDIVLLLKDARALPSTSLWMSNGGRDYAPWNGRHVGVLGIEDSRSYGTGGHRAAISPNRLREQGYPTAFDLSTNPTVRYAIGAVALPAGWTRIEAVSTDGRTLALHDAGGESLTLPFAGAWLLGDTAQLSA